MDFRLAWATDPGLHREKNEDSVLVWQDRAGVDVLVVIADGMGGHAAGQLASSIAIDVLSQELEKDGGSGCSPNRLHSAFLKANSAVLTASRTVPHASGMGTTLTVAALRDGKLGLLNVGDSPAYLIREARAQMITEDHSWAAEQVRLGVITAIEAKHHPFKHRLTRAVGVWEEVDAYTAALEIAEGDLLVVCSDGVESAGVEVDEVQRFLDSDDLERACDEIIACCRDRGAPDNVTVAAVRLGDRPASLRDTVRISTGHQLGEMKDLDGGAALTDTHI